MTLPASHSTKLKPELNRARRLAVIVHRYVGLVLSVFLIVAGATGALLAFFEDIDALVVPALYRVAPPTPGAKPLDPFVLRERIQEQLPASQLASEVQLTPRPDRSLRTWIEVEPEKWRQAFFDPYTGASLGSRDWGSPTQGRQNLMPFVYRLHYSLALDQVGTFLFGLAALLWTLDCFVGFYITLPTPARRAERAPGSALERVQRWFKRWLPAWLLRAGKLFSLVFTWHRASGLWVWGMLLVFAWSAVGLNLPQVYDPVMQAVTGRTKSGHAVLPELPRPHPQPELSWRAAHERGRELMAEEARKRGFQIEREVGLAYASEHGAFAYRVQSSLDISNDHPRTEVFFDGRDGHFVTFDAATGVSAGGTISSWLFALHMAMVGGTWYRVVVLVMGVAVTLLSITGVWIWWRKRQTRTRQRTAAASEPELDEPQLARPA